MPTKKNFLGGEQNYNPKTGEYESRLVKADGTGATKENMPGGTDGKGNPQPKKEAPKGPAANNPDGGLKGREAPKEKEPKYRKTKWGAQFSEDGRSAITSNGHKIEKGQQLPSGDYVTGFDPDTNTIFIDGEQGVEGGRDYDIDDLDDEIAEVEAKTAQGPRVTRDRKGNEYHFEKGNTFVKTKSGRTIKMDEDLGGNFKGLYATGFDPRTGNVLLGTKPEIQDAGDYDINDLDHDLDYDYGTYNRQLSTDGEKEDHMTLTSIYAKDLESDKAKLEEMGIRIEKDKYGDFRLVGPEKAIQQYYDEFTGNKPKQKIGSGFYKGRYRMDWSGSLNKEKAVESLDDLISQKPELEKDFGPLDRPFVQEDGSVTIDDRTFRKGKDGRWVVESEVPESYFGEPQRTKKRR